MNRCRTYKLIPGCLPAFQCELDDGHDAPHRFDPSVDGIPCVEAKEPLQFVRYRDNIPP